MAWYNPFSWPRAAGEFIGEHVVYPGLKAVGMTDDDIIDNTVISYMAEKDEVLKEKGIVTTMVSMGLDGTNAAGNALGEHVVYPAIKGMGYSDDDIIDAYENSQFLTSISDAGDYMQSDTDRAAEVIWRSIAEKGPGAIAAIPGEILDLVGVTDDAGGATRKFVGDGIGGAQDFLGIDRLEIKNKEEAFLSGLYGEIPAMATLFMGNGAVLARLSGKYPKLATALKVAAPVAKTGLTAGIITAQGVIEKFKHEEEGLDKLLIDKFAVKHDELEGLDFEAKVELAMYKQEEQFDTYIKETFDFTSEDLEGLSLEEKSVYYSLGQLADSEVEKKAEATVTTLDEVDGASSAAIDAATAAFSAVPLLSVAKKGASAAIKAPEQPEKQTRPVRDVETRVETEEPLKKQPAETAVRKQAGLSSAFMTKSTETMSGRELEDAVDEAKAYAKRTEGFSLSAMFNVSSGFASALSWIVGDNNSWVKGARSYSLGLAKDQLTAFNQAASGGRVAYRSPDTQLGQNKDPGLSFALT